MLDGAGVAYQKDVPLTWFSAVCACSQKCGGVNYPMQGAHIFSASPLRSFSTKSLNVLFIVLPKGLIHMSLGE